MFPLFCIVYFTLLLGFREKEGAVIVEGVGGVLRSDFTKNQDIRYLKKIENKK